MPTSTDHKENQTYEFGPFRVDADKELLQRGDEIIPLAPKAFQILLVLMRHGKELVTKDDLLKTVWPDTFVEEANLSRNIFLLRKALGESPQDHQYIVTVPGRGYRFAEEVRLAGANELSVVAASHSRIQIQVEECGSRRGIAGTAILSIAVIAVGVRFWLHRAPVLTDKDTIVLADFANSTGDAVFDGTLRQGLSVQLEQSPFLSLVSDERIQQTLTLMAKPADSPLSPEVAREVCQRTGSAAVLEGSIASLGSQYVLGLRAKNCRTGAVLDEEQLQAAQKEDVLHALDQIAAKFRTRVGESLQSLQQHNTPLAEATTPSLEALKAYSKGWPLLYSNPPAAIPFFTRAIELDPQFAMAHAVLGLMYGTTGESALAAEYTNKAYEL